MNSCRDCRYSQECDHGSWICVHPDLLEAGTTIIVGASWVCSEWKEIGNDSARIPTEDQCHTYR